MTTSASDPIEYVHLLYGERVRMIRGDGTNLGIGATVITAYYMRRRDVRYLLVVVKMGSQWSIDVREFPENTRVLTGTAKTKREAWYSVKDEMIERGLW